MKPLGEPPTTLAQTRSSLTTLTFYVLSPARQQANGKIGLRWTKGGFGTPFFGDDRPIRVEGDLLVVQDEDANLEARAGYGASPGDGAIAMPYLYVSPWSTQRGGFWNAPFGGAALTLDSLRAAADPLDAALSFFDEARRLLG